MALGDRVGGIVANGSNTHFLPEQRPLIRSLVDGAALTQ